MSKIDLDIVDFQIAGKDIAVVCQDIASFGRYGVYT